MSEAHAETIVRVVKRENPYVSIERATLQDTALSWAVRGMLAYLLSLPRDWKIKVEHLQGQGDAGRDAVRHILGELQARGYASGFGARERGERGRLSTSADIVVYESPNLNPYHKPEGSPETEKPSPERPATASPAPESPATANTSAYKRNTLQKKQETNKTPTHGARPRVTQPAAQATGSADAGVGVPSSSSVAKSKHAKQTCVEWAGWKKKQPDSGIRDPYAVGRARWQDGTADDEIDAYLAGKNPEAAKVERAAAPDISSCPDCHGAGMYYPEGYEKGVAKCTHPRLNAPATSQRAAPPRPPVGQANLHGTPRGSSPRAHLHVVSSQDPGAV